MDIVTLSVFGIVGASLSFIGDMILYLPSDYSQWGDTTVYFQSIDPFGSNLSQSPMKDLSLNRIILGSIMGPFATIPYVLGFAQLYYGLLPNENGILLSLLSSIGFCITTIVGLASYHTGFVYTAILAKGTTTTAQQASNYGATTTSNTTAEERVIAKLMVHHVRNMKCLYVCMVIPALLSAICFMGTYLFRRTIYTLPSFLFCPIGSVPIKLAMKHFNVGGIILSGGLSNLWTLVFFVMLTLDAHNYCNTSTTDDYCTAFN